MREENNLIFFRCVIPVASRPLDPALEGEAIVASAWVALFQIDRFSEVIELTANGFMTLDQAVKTVDELTQLPPDNR